MKKGSAYLIFVWVLLSLATGCVSARKVIIEAQAYSSVVQKGTIQKNEEEEGAASTQTNVISVYVHTKTNQLQFDSVWLNDQPFSFQVQQLKQPLELGFDLNNEKQIVAPKSKQFLFQLTVIGAVKTGGKRIETVRLKGQYKQRHFYQVIQPVVPLQGFDAQ